MNPDAMKQGDRGQEIDRETPVLGALVNAIVGYPDADEATRSRMLSYVAARWRAMCEEIVDSRRQEELRQLRVEQEKRMRGW